MDREHKAPRQVLAGYARQVHRRLDANIDLRATQFHELIVEAIHRRGMRGVLWRYGYHRTLEQLNFCSGKKSGVYQPLELISGE
jgi:hypothetical protein